MFILIKPSPLWHNYYRSIIAIRDNSGGSSKIKLEQLERLRSEDTPRRLMITHTIGSQVKKIIDLELKTLQSRHDFQSQGQMTLKI